MYVKSGYKIKPSMYLEKIHPIYNVDLSLVIPAYNEEARLQKTVEDTLKYFEHKHPALKLEIIIVNDGSKDNTWQLIQNIINKYNNKEITGITYEANAGKGYAVTSGMKYARGNYVLMLDADGATDINDFEKLWEAVHKEPTNIFGEIAIGSRNHLADNVSSQRSLFRNILMHVNNFIYRNLIGLGNIKDTQCGFKLFDRKAAHKIFMNMHLRRWAWDVEMLFLARKKFNIEVTEIPVNWREIEGSKLSPISASISFFRDYFSILSFYNTRFWKVVSYN